MSDLRGCVFWGGMGGEVVVYLDVVGLWMCWTRRGMLVCVG